MTNFTDIELANKVGLKVAKVTVPAASVLALNATPYTLVEAPSSTDRGDIILEFVGAMFHKPAGTAYAAVGADDDLEIRYTNASGAQVNTLLECTGFVDQTTAQTRSTRPIVTEYTPVANAALVLHMKTGEITTGNSPLYVTVLYREWRDCTAAA
jgi:hypothetical protein